MNKKECYVCKKECLCSCFEVDTDYFPIYFCSLDCYNKSNTENDWGADLGEYEGHYAECKFGGHFKEKWGKVVKQLDIWRDMANEKQLPELIDKKIKEMLE